MDSVVAIYAVAEGESSDSLSFSSINIINNGAALRDVAGNDMATDFNVPDGSSLKQTSAVQIDGIYPEDFTISNIWTDGSSIVDGYWNSSSTRLIVRVREYNSTEDTTLIDGTVQLKMRVYTNNNTTPGTTWLNLGNATTLNDQNLEPDGIWVEGGTRLDYSQISNKALHFAIEASVLEDIAGFPDLNANPQPEQNVLIDFNAVITDKAGNEKLGTSAAQLTVDEVEPLDPKDGLPSGTYSYQFPGGVTFDNYLDVTSEYDQSGTGYSRSGYYNSTNNGITFKSWIGFDDVVNANVTIDRDASLVDGYIQVLMSSVTDLAISNWKAVGDSVVITDNDINSNDPAFVNVFVHDTSLIAYNADIFKENRTVYFRNKVTDAAGNSIYQKAISSYTILVDETAHSAANLLYSRKYINTDSLATLELTFPSDDPPFGLPKLSATFKATPAEPVVDKLMSDTLANNYTFYYNLDIPGSLNDPAYDDTVAISIDATDLAGNPLPVDSLNNSKYLIVDNTPPKVWFQYTNTDNEVVNDPASVVPDSLDIAKGGDIVQIIAHLTEPMWKTDDVIATNEVLKPSLSIRTNSGILLTADYDSIDGTYNELDSTITFNVEMPSAVENNNNTYEGRLMMIINGVDLAANTIQPIDGNINNDNQNAYIISPDLDSAHVKWNSFKLDNRSPTFRIDNFNPAIVVADNN